MLRTFTLAFAGGFLLLMVATSVSAEEATLDAGPMQFEIGAGDFINDLSVSISLLKAGKELLKNDTLLKSPDIQKQLDDLDSSIKLDLPEPSGEKERQRSFDSTVVIGFLYDCGKCDKKHVGMASGVVISSDGLILTNQHVFGRGTMFIHFVMTRDGKVYPVEKILAASEANDIALFKIAATDLTYSSIAAVVPQPLDDIYTISHPDRNFFYASTGQVARYVERVRENYKTRWLQIDGEFSRGSSGGPVFDSNGNVVGLISRQMPQLAEDGHVKIMFHECVPVQVIHEFVSGNLVDSNPVTANVKKNGTAADEDAVEMKPSLTTGQRSEVTTQLR